MLPTAYSFSSNVCLGSRNRPSWPIYSGVPNAGVARKVELTAGSVETEEELARNRLEVAQNAGLKHVEVINGDEAFYPQPMKDYGECTPLLQCCNSFNSYPIFRLSMGRVPPPCVQGRHGRRTQAGQ